MRDEPRRGRLLLLTIALLLALHNANRFGIAGIFGALRLRFGGAYTAVGNLFSAYPLAYACTQIPAGWLADRFDPRRVILVGTALATGAALVFAVTDSYVVAYAARLVLGVCGALIYTPAMSFGITSFPSSRRGTAMGFAYVGVGLGTAASLTLLPPLVERVGLTGALLAVAAFGALMTVLAPVGLALRRGEPRPRGRRPAGVLRQRSFQCLLAFSFLGYLNTYAVMTWMPAYLSDALGVPAASAGALAAVANVTMTIASPLAGKLSDVLPGRRRILELGALASLAAFLVLGGTRALPLVILASVLAGVASAMTTAPAFVFASEVVGAGAAGFAVGMVNAVAQTGSALSGVVFGALLDWTGTFSGIWWTCVPIAVVRYLLLRAVADVRARG